MLKENMDKSRVDEGEILSAARIEQGIERMADINDATIENDGKISVVPKR